MVVLDIALILLSVIILGIVVGCCLFLFVFIPVTILISPWLDRIFENFTDWEDTWNDYWGRKRNNE